MTLNRVLTLAAIFVAATALLYLSGARRQSRQTRVFIAELLNQPEAELAQAAKYLREACPDMIVIRDQERADYRLNALWRGGHWTVFVHRKDLPFLFVKQDSSDVMETFRQACNAIREDVKGVASFDADTAPMPIGRYSLTVLPGNQNVINSEHIYLLDTKTGAAWELKPVGDNQVFERISVEGLYNRKPFGP
jgi:hypothetical protein